MLALPASYADVLAEVIVPGFTALPSEMDTPEARLIVLATGGVETQFRTREQDGHPAGGANGLFQMQYNCVLDVMHNKASGNLVWNLCGVLGVTYGSNAIFDALLTNDELAACMTRLAYWCDPRPLPQVGDMMGAWDTYERVQRPGKPSHSRWKQCYPQALTALQGAA